jgi:hypothetical protein
MGGKDHIHTRTKRLHRPAYRNQLENILDDFGVNVLSHDEIISKLDRAGQTFRVLVIKTKMTIPYASVFFELDCAYWNAEAEHRLRSALASENGRGSEASAK